MFRESKRLEDIDVLIDWQEFWRRYLNSYLEYGEQVSIYATATIALAKN